MTGFICRFNDLEENGWDACTSSQPCHECQGDCDSDSDCAGILRCRHRSDGENVPGCMIGGSGDISGLDYCHNPISAVVLGVAITGLCADSYEGDFVPQARIVLGCWWYENSAGPKLYQDQDCKGKGAAPRWILDDSSISITTVNDLDGDGGCRYQGRIESTARVPPSGTWREYCDGAWTDRVFIVSSMCPSVSSYTSKSDRDHPAATLEDVSG